MRELLRAICLEALHQTNNPKSDRKQWYNANKARWLLAWQKANNYRIICVDGKFQLK
jgi:hypothetical protein